MRRAELKIGRRLLAALACWVGVSASAATAGASSASCTGAAGEKPVYLTFDTGHMEIAPLVAEVLQRHRLKATFFLANERTRTGGASLDDQWAPWWRARAAEGHLFGSHTFDHAVWAGDTKGGFKVRPTAGPEAGRTLRWTAADYCESLQQSATRFEDMTGKKMAPIFRAAGGKTSSALLAAAKSCGWEHVPWTDAGFLGDELPSDKYPNKMLLNRALRNIRSGEILLAHLGIWSREEVWAPAVLEPLIVGLRERGFCFATLRDHPRYSDWLKR
ncbi:polysaccharide deacetylase family protein [Piscinibacter sakaiensis]|uniref:polysaccharide deacetylase family protein n=1 Tax=Piscinibacter sakaiensis TaxID=1547922 RepID=UPI003AAA32BC